MEPSLHSKSFNGIS